MNPVLLFPAGLAALTALAVPVIIHLARQSDVRLVDFAALRWLEPNPRPRHRLRLDEWPLLIARLILLALVALWLARPAFSDGADPSPWVAVVPGADLAQVTLPVASERHWLSAGFPSLDRSPLAGPIAVASLLRQLDAELPPGAALRVLVPSTLDGADAELPRLSRAVTWTVVPGTTNAPRTTPQPTLPLVVRYAPERAASVRYLRAAANAWQPVGRPTAFDAAPASVALPSGRGNLVWLVPGRLPAPVAEWIRRGGTVLLDASTTDGTPAETAVWADNGVTLVNGTRLGAGRVLRLTRPLVPATMPQLLEPEFPQRLRALFAGRPFAPARVAAAAHAPLTGATAYQQPARTIQPWLALVIVAVLLAERWLATGRRAGAAR